MSQEFWDTSSMLEDNMSDFDFDDAIPDIPDNAFSEGEVDMSEYETAPRTTAAAASLGGAIGGMAGGATMATGQSFAAARSYQPTGPQIGASFMSLDGQGFRLTFTQEAIPVLAEALNSVIAELQTLAAQGQKPSKYATVLALDLRPNPAYRPGSKLPVGVITMANRGAIKTEASAQRAVAPTQVAAPSMGAATMQNALGIITSATVAPVQRTNVTTEQAAVRTVAPTPTNGIVSLINMG